MSSVAPIYPDGTEAVSAHVPCFHCGLPVSAVGLAERSIGNTMRSFCCPGCATVCSAIYDAGLQGFYQRAGTTSPLAPPPEAPTDVAHYDLDEVQAEFVQELATVRDIQLLVTGMHCAACVWLIERKLAQEPGVLAVRANLSGRKLLLRWDNTRITLSALLIQLARIGYAAVPYDPWQSDMGLRRDNRGLLLRMAFAGFAMMNLLWISIALYSGADRGEFRELFHWVGFGLATPTLFYAGYPFLAAAFGGLRRRYLTMDLPIAIGALSTYGYSLYVTLAASTAGDVYYDTVVNFLFVILVGRYLEAMSRQRAVAASERLLDVQPRAATVWRDGKAVLVPLRAVQVGDQVLVKPGDRIPVDGALIAGATSVDESLLSGESLPVAKEPGDAVCAGSVNLEHSVTVRVTATLQHTTLGRIISLVSQAQASRAPIQCLTDRIVPWFVAATLVLASITFSYWLASGFETALMAATAVLIITCPCAFGLATPMVVASASGLAAQSGILVKHGAALETLAGVNQVVFDKTGTLTSGRMQVREVVTTNPGEIALLLSCAAALECHSEHALATAIVAAAGARQLTWPAAAQVRNHPGQGVCGVVGGAYVRLGSRRWLQEHDILLDAALQAQVATWEQDACTCVHIGIDGREAGFIALSDPVRVDAKPLIAALRAEGKGVTILSGDRQPVVAAVARGVGCEDYYAELLPAQKQQIIRRLQAQGRRIAMIGDGINDAPALSSADVGIAMGSGTDLAAGSADIVLMSERLDRVRAVIGLAQRATVTMRQNIVLSLAYNGVMVPLAMMALVTPLVAAIAMPISSLLVIGNAARLRRFFRHQPRQAGVPWT